VKQLIKKILKEETELPISVKRRIDVDKINKLINQYKLTSFNTDWSVDECVMATVAKVSGNLIPVFEYDDDEHDNLYNSLRKFLYDRYVEELKLYFEKRKEDYKNRKPSNVFYIFKKHKDGRGFSEGFLYFDDLVNRFGTWVDVDWIEVKNELDKINYYPEDTFEGRMNSRPLRISTAGDKGNDWGYDFFIIKSIKK
jgi:hypothetical protein